MGKSLFKPSEGGQIDILEEGDDIAKVNSSTGSGA
jgi:hypothetical protein